MLEFGVGIRFGVVEGWLDAGDGLGGHMVEE